MSDHQCVKWNLSNAAYCQCPRGTLGCSGGSPQSWWCSRCPSWWGGPGRCRREVSSARPQSVSACRTGRRKTGLINTGDKKTTTSVSISQSDASCRSAMDIVGSRSWESLLERIHWAVPSKQTFISIETRRCNKLFHNATERKARRYCRWWSTQQGVVCQYDTAKQ